MFGKQKHILANVTLLTALVCHAAIDEAIGDNLDLDPEIIRKALEGDSSAQLTVGITYYHATFIKANCYSAFKWIKLSADQGNMEAQFRLADIYALGHGVDRNIAFAHEWYTKSALQDYSKALVRLHNLYEEDIRIHCRGELNSEEEGMNEPDFKKKHNARELNEYRLDLMKSRNLLGCTIEFFTKEFKTIMKSNTDDKDTQYYIGFLYRYGYGFRKIIKRAIEWHTKSAEKGHTIAQYNLACLYQQNTDIKFNYHHAFKWYEKASIGGNNDAQNYLAYFYEKGLAVEPDLSKAIYWYNLAAENNNKGAMLNLARINRKGLLRNVDLAQSAKWYAAAAKKGSSVAKNCLYILSHKDNISHTGIDIDSDLFDNELFAQNRLCSRLRLDISNMVESPKFNQLEKLASHALVGDANAMLEVAFKYFEGSDLAQDKDIGFRWMQKAAKAGLIKAQLIVAKKYEEGVAGVVVQDYNEAFIWYSLVAKRKNKIAQYHVGLMYYKGHGARKDPLEASKWFTLSADQGNSDSQYMLGILRYKGEGLSQDFMESYEWFLKSASQKNLKALYQLGTIYWEGKEFENNRSIKDDIKRSILFYKYSANNGNLDAQLLLARMHENGYFIEKDRTKAFEYYLLAAKNGCSDAKYKIGCMYLNGKVIKQDYLSAFKWLNEAFKDNHQKAKALFSLSMEEPHISSNYVNVLNMFSTITDRGIDSLEYNIGCLYEKGYGSIYFRNYIPLDLVKACFWFKAAGKKNHPKALYRLGRMYEEGKGVSQDYSLAVYYYKKAAELTDIDSLNALARLYSSGMEVEHDISRAFDLYFFAANRGDLVARRILSLLYKSKEGTQNISNYQKVIKMLEKVAADGNTIVQYRIGEYHESQGNIYFAIKWYELAAKGRLTVACYRLGKIYENAGEYRNYSKAIELYQSAINNNHDESMYRMANIYLYGSGIERDYAKAFKLYTKSMNLGNKAAFEMLNITKQPSSTTNFEENSVYFIPSQQEFRSSLSMCEYVAKHGNVDIQYRVGYVYEIILDSPNFTKSIEWYTMAASNSHSEAAYRLGLLYAKGLGISQNWSKATEYLGKASNLGNSSASFELGLIYHRNKDVKIDEAKVIKYYRLAAEQESSDGQLALGKLFEEGEIVQKNLIEAIKWYMKAYLQDNTNAVTQMRDLDDGIYLMELFDQKSYQKLQRYLNQQQGGCKERDCTFCGYVSYQIGLIYFYGIGTEINYKKAWTHFCKANREHNHKNALEFIKYEDHDIAKSEIVLYRKKFEMFKDSIDVIDSKQLFDIGLIYRNGKYLVDGSNYCVIEPDGVQAHNFFSKSSEKGYLESQRLLGELYYYGTGVDTDCEKGLCCHVAWAREQDDLKIIQTARHYYNIMYNKSANRMIAFIYFNIAVNHKNLEAQKFLEKNYYTNQESSTYRENSIAIHKTISQQQDKDRNTELGLLYYHNAKKIKENYSISAVYFQKASEQGNPTATQYLGLIYYNGYGVEKNKDQAIKFFESSSIQLSSYEAYKLGRKYYEGSEDVQQNRTIGLIYLTSAVEREDGESERYMADLYYYGDGIERELEKAIKLYKSSTKHFSYSRSSGIGKEYHEGSESITKNASIAIIYLEEAANQNDPSAQRYLADMYYYGDGVKQDREKAIGLHKSSAALRQSIENYDIGREYHEGSESIKKNTSIALIYLEEAANKKDPSAQRYLADMYYYGDGVEQDIEKAIYLHKSSAALRQPADNCSVGREYHEGSKSIKKNPSIAFIYLEEAANKKDFSAQRYLADTYYYGDGVEQDREKAIGLHKSLAVHQDSNDNYGVGREYHKGLEYYKKDASLAVIYLEEAANQKYPSALYYLANMYYNGDGVEQDIEKTFKLHKSLAKLQDSNDNYSLGRKYQKGSESIKKNNFIAFIYLEEAANKMDPSAKTCLADMYYYGGDIEQDREKAIGLHKSSAALRHPIENYDIGREYHEGSESIKKNTSIALIYLEEAANKKDPSAQRYLADMYYYGDGVEQDIEKAIYLHKSSAILQWPADNYNIGRRYHEGSESIIRNNFIALMYLEDAAIQNDPSAQRYLADMYYYGNGVEQDIEKAIRLHKSSARLQLPANSYHIYCEYHKGSESIKKNTSIAFIYLEEAANQKYPSALYYLANMYYNGDGVEQDIEKTFKLHKSLAKLQDSNDNYSLGRKYHKGSESIKKNNFIALIYLEEAANKKDPSAQRYLADMYYYGDGVEQVIEKAIYLHRSSAAIQHHADNYSIGRGYHEGSESITKNNFIAFIYLEEAASQNDPSAQRYLADTCYYGDGVEQDREKAIGLHKSLAAQQDSDDNYDVGREYHKGSKYVKKNIPIAIIYLEKAANQNDPSALHYLANMYYNGDGVEQDIEKAIDLHRSSAALRQPADNCSVGREYHEGSESIIRNNFIAFIYFRKAADQGELRSKKYLEVICNDVDVKKDIRELYYQENCSTLH